MLSIQVLKSSGGGGAALGQYFEKESAQENYWAAEAKQATAWHGQAAEKLGLSGAVDQQDFENLMDGKLPDGQQLAHGAGGKRRMGYDLTFSAPKSVSVAGLLDDERIIAAHDAAVKSALDFTETEGAQTRIKTGGEITREKTGNLAVATFRHETSRNLDPQLHTHSVVANATQSKDGHWRGLDAREIYQNKMAAGAVYRGELAKNLQEFGYWVKITDPRKGTFELEGFSKKQLDRFSSRRQEIEAKLKSAASPKSAKAAESAALGTRQRKQRATDKTELRAGWREAAEKSGIRFNKPQAARPQLAERAAEFRARKIVAETFKDFRKFNDVNSFQQLRGKAMQKGVGQRVGMDKIKDEFGKQFKQRLQKGHIVAVDGKFMDPRPMQRVRLTAAREVVQRLKPKELQEAQSAWYKVKFAARQIQAVGHLAKIARAKIKPKPLKTGRKMSVSKSKGSKIVGKILKGGGRGMGR